MAGNNPRSRQAEGKNDNEVSQITNKVKPTLTVPTPEARPKNGYDVPMPVDRERAEDGPEYARQLANSTRDLRTQLGRQKASNIVVD